MVGNGMRWLAVGTALAALAACGSQPLAPPATLAPNAPAAVEPLPAPTAVPSTVAAGAGGPTTTTEVGLAPDGPWHRVDAVPGVRVPGLAYELVPGLWAWLPVDEDVRHGVVWTLTATDREVVEAYLQARLTFVRTTTVSPFAYDDAGWRRWFLDGGAAFRSLLQVREREGELYSLDRGVVLRPTVLGEGRSATTAIVFDCMLDGGLWLRPDGSPGEGTRRGIAASGVATELRRVDGEWRIGHLAPQPEACA
ncbi:MAG: hypothetical protein RLZ14_1839 [Actinomycetota bacterium]